jgi:hypothetical protein
MRPFPYENFMNCVLENFEIINETLLLYFWITPENKLYVTTPVKEYGVLKLNKFDNITSFVDAWMDEVYGSVINTITISRHTKKLRVEIKFLSKKENLFVITCNSVEFEQVDNYHISKESWQSSIKKYWSGYKAEVLKSKRNQSK